MHCSRCLTVICTVALLCWTCDGFGGQKDCILSQWSDWSECSLKCLSGKSTRFRNITQKAQGMFATDCHVNRTHSRSCGMENNGCEMLCEPSTGKCHCKRGYELGRDQKKCFNSNECLHNDGLGYCSQKCVDTEGSYECRCNIGFHLAPDGHDCIYDTALNCSDEIHVRTTRAQKKCICKNGFIGTLCDRNPLLCSIKNKSVCHENDLCLTFIHAGDKCVQTKSQIPILLKMKYKTFTTGNTVHEVEKYIEDILEGTPSGKSLDDLRGRVSPLSTGPAKDIKYYVESLMNVQVKSSFTYVKFGALDATNNFKSLKMKKICSLLKSSDVQCVTESDCNTMREDGLPCPTVTNYNSAEVLSEESTNSKHKLKPWVYILISGFAVILILLITLVYMYLKRSKHSHDTSAMYNNNATQPILFRAEYDPLSQRDAVASWNNDPRNFNDSRNFNDPQNFPPIHSAGTTLEAANFELYGNDSESLRNSGPIYESISSLKKCIDNELCSSSTAINNKTCEEPRYVEPRNIDFRTMGNSSKNVEASLSDDGKVCTQVVDIPDDGKGSGYYGDCGKEDAGELVVDVHGGEEARYSSPPGRK